ncbi:hypothetical protein [Flavisolibacter tropicus]|uniref:Uncharacterized protein n=1 Tax=Flavisolibacter tropicus TaxID=1492898 RepID=A0A172TTC6_9BACT|nr:hypothetical protein [Flavisolibacter tropicus]ANE50256.1 hypothetical protein SY85_06840 [Flavisolibacter tropicus]
MDRVHVLIEKLLTQKAANETPAQLQVTVLLLHEELRRLQQESYIGTSKKVAVVLPTVARNVTVEKESAVLQTEEVIQPVKVVPVAPVVEPKEEKPMFRQPSFFDEPEAVSVIKEEPVQAVDVQPESVKEPYFLKKPDFVPHEPVKEERQEQPQYHTLLPFDVMDEIPTFSQQQQPSREVHEVIGGKEASLNDKLKQEKTDLANALKDTPIKDLRKGIGVNDKFLFINELFRGDEGLYERSIKTINAFNILPEAEYWINRELKIKLGWNDDKEVVQYFYQLVKRRFS